DNTDLDLACDLFKDKRILLCIDNLETILRDAQDDCIEFLEKLPPLWKVLVTTRVPVDGFKSLRIKELNENSAMGMAARYLQSKGSDDYTKDDTKKIAEIAKCNPLAIRLTIDGFVRGNPLCDAAVTANTEVVKFSFDRLIGSLEADSIRFIETLYQAGKVGRTELPGLVGITLDRAIEIVRSLLNTSVISRDLSEEEEFYSLTSSMKEYVLHSEANIKIRRSVRNAINKREKRIRYVEQRQDNVSLNKNDYFFIPNDIPPGLKEPLYNAVKAIKTYNEHKFYRAASEALRNLKKFENTFNKNLTYRYYLGTLHRLLGDVDSALTHINYVVERDPTYFQARLLQAQLTSEFEDRDSIQSSEGLYKNLIEDVEEGVFGDITPSGSYHTNRGYYTCLYKLRKYDQLVQLSQNWEDSSDKLKQLRGSFYSIGLSMIMNGQHDDKIEKITGPLSEAAKQLKKTIRECGLSYDTIFAFSIIAKEGSHVFAFRREDIDDETSFEFLAELAGCLEYIDLNRESRSARELFQRIKRYLCNLRRVHTKYGNRIKQLYMPPSKINLTNKSRMEASGRGLLTVKIITVPRGNHRALFRFGRAHDGEEFFLSFNKLKSQSLSQWEDISVGDHVAIKPGHRPDLSKDREAEVIYLESDFETDSLN
ncbi:MAG: hypothetical protein KJO79_11000, partial [Verrucomicrobiae bacterium]|nr:hypothetical protein [Verrucomicrobiae bacterium]NNJ87702.1 hypothetical protein [Akkermansiaceae bacterium]